MTKLNHKERNRYTGLINKKLDQMGIGKELRYKQVCTKKMSVRRPDGKIEVVDVPRFVAQSVRRQMRKQLLESGKRVIEAFLKMDISNLKKATK